MQQKIWVFGDSFTFGQGCRPDGPLVEYYHQYKKDGDKIWVDWISDYMKLETVNLGSPGVSNDYIIDSIIDNWKHFNKNDYVIVGITFFQRFDIPHKGIVWPIFYDWENIIKNKISNPFTKEEFETIINYKFYFSNDTFYKKRQFKRFNFLENLLIKNNINIFFWEVEPLVRSFETIFTATNGKINDFHFSFEGHKSFADFIFQKLTKKHTLI